jgi:hypothetical protein
MATRNHTEDQRTDTLLTHLTVLTQAVTLALGHLEALLQDPVSPTREHQIAEILQALARVNTQAMQRGLGKSLRAVHHEQQRVETLVARQRQDHPA